MKGRELIALEQMQGDRELCTAAATQNWKTLEIWNAVKGCELIVLEQRQRDRARAGMH